MRLEFDNLGKRYGNKHALRGINFRSPDSHAVCVLIGPSGGGKSTLLRLLGGLLEADEGVLRVDGLEVPCGAGELLAYRRRHGFVFQQFNLFPHLTVEENIVLPLCKAHGWRRDEAVARAYEVLARFGLEGFAGRHPHALSGGQAQRVALARALAPRPQRLLLDEPTSALDPEMTAEVLDEVRRLAEEGQEIIVSTHSMPLARLLGGHTLFLQEGRLAGSAATGEFFACPPHPDIERFLAKVMRF